MGRLRGWLLARRGTAAVSKRAVPAVGKSAIHASASDLIALRLSAQELKFSQRNSLSSVVIGSHGSRFRGRGMDYQESRSYQPGDDIRNMDWRVTARAGHPYVKLYREERERPVMVLLDLNPGMFFATKGVLKTVVGARFAALIGWAATGNGDRVGALLFNGGHREIPPRGGRPGAMRLIRSLVEATNPTPGIRIHPHPATMTHALERLRRVTRPGSLVFVVSDFYGLDDEIRKHLLRLRRHNDVIAVQVTDPIELTPPPRGCYGITDGRERMILDTRSSHDQDAYHQWLDCHHRQVRQLLQSASIPLLQLSTTGDVVTTVRDFFAHPQALGLPTLGIQAA